MDRKRIEEKLRQAVEVNQAVMASMGEGLYTLDGRGLVAYVNPAAERLLGWRHDELFGRKMHDTFITNTATARPFPPRTALD